MWTPAQGRQQREYQVTAKLQFAVLDDPGPFEKLEIWEQFLAEVEAMPDFTGRQAPSTTPSG
jgi:hypothetical protein